MSLRIRVLQQLLLIGVSVVLSIYRVAEAADSPRPLPDADRQILSEYLGTGVIGRAIAPPALANGLNDLISLHDDVNWQMKVISGNARGTIERGSAKLLNRPDHAGFRIDTGDGRNVLFGQVDAKGNLMCYAAQDNQEGVVSRFSPPQPIVLAGLVPGESRQVISYVSVADLSQPDVQTHSGKLNIEFQFVGAYRVHVPAGTIDAVLFKTRLTGRIGPAAIDDTIYRFFAKNSGLVAEVETNNVSAILIYHEKTRIGKVLLETALK